jgi:uncharacterized protein YecA (UPF0149 family)
MSERQRQLVQVKAVSMYPAQWTIVNQFSQDQGYGSTSAALRRIVDEWKQMKSAGLLLVDAASVSTHACETR